MLTSANAISLRRPTMTWFDSSFSFAKQAISKAQQSIDRVLDIQEEGEGNGDNATGGELLI